MHVIFISNLHLFTFMNMNIFPFLLHRNPECQQCLEWIFTSKRNFYKWQGGKYKVQLSIFIHEPYYISWIILNTYCWYFQHVYHVRDRNATDASILLYDDKIHIMVPFLNIYHKMKIFLLLKRIGLYKIIC